MIDQSSIESRFTENISVSSNCILENTQQVWGKGLVFTHGQECDDKITIIKDGIQRDISERYAQLLNESGLSDEDIERSLQNAPLVMSCFFEGTHLKKVDHAGVINLAELALRSCLEPQTFSNLQIRVGFGVSDADCVSPRVLAYPLTAKKILDNLDCKSRLIVAVQDERIQAQFSNKVFNKVRSNILRGKTISEPNQQQMVTDIDAAAQMLDLTKPANFPQELPQVILYSAANFVVDANGIDEERALNNRDRIFKAIRAFVEETSSSRVAARFEYVNDIKLQNDPLLTALVAYLGWELSEADSDIAREIVAKMQRRGDKNNWNMEKSLRYAAAHAVYSADEIDTPVFSILADITPRPRDLLMIGGEGERFYWDIRQIVASQSSFDRAHVFLRQYMTSPDVDEASKSELAAHYARYEKRFDAILRRIRNGKRTRTQMISTLGGLPPYSVAPDDIAPADVMSENFPKDLKAKGVRSDNRREMDTILSELGGEIGKLQEIVSANLGV